MQPSFAPWQARYRSSLAPIDRTYEGARMLGRRTSSSDLINNIDIDREHGNISRRPYG